MSKNTDRIVYQRDDGMWANKRRAADRASDVHDTQRDAARRAREQLAREGGGELTIKGENGRIRSKDTIPPGNDPNPPRDREH